jgi:oligoendopeptidase F
LGLSQFARRATPSRPKVSECTTFSRKRAFYFACKVAGEMRLEEFTKELEEEEVALSLEFYKQYAGLEYSTDLMDEKSSRIQELCLRGLEAFSPQDLPELLFYALVDGSIAKEMTRLQNELYRRRQEEVTVEADGEKVNLNNVRLFNHRHVKDHVLRKRVFDGLMERAPALTDTINDRFELVRDTYRAHDLDPLQVYCRQEQVSLDRLKELVHESGIRAKPRFLEMAEGLSPEVIGKAMEYYDDFYVFRHVINARFNPYFAKVDYDALLRRTARRLGLGAEEVDVDGEPREGKHSSPVCFGIRIPGDVRVLYQATDPYGDFTSFFHEMGHGLHFVSVDAARPYHERALIQRSVAETFSTLFEELAQDPLFLKEEAGLSEDIIAHVEERRRFMDLFFLTFYAANSMLKIRYWEKGLTMTEADREYERLYTQYTDLPMPGIYWQTHHIVGMYVLYAPSYLMANIRKSELLQRLRDRFGDAWWRSSEAGRYLREELMGPGAAIDLNAFSRLDPEPYLKGVLGAEA